MKKVSLISIFLFLIISTLSAADLYSNFNLQDSAKNPSLSPEKSLICRGSLVFLNKKRLSFNEVKDIYNNYPEISSLYVAGYKFKSAGKAFMVAGIVGTSVGTFLTALGKVYKDINAVESDPTYTAGITMTSIFAPMIPMSIAFKIIGANKIKASVNKYNSKILGTNSKTKLEYNLALSPSGIGIQIRF